MVSKNAVLNRVKKEYAKRKEVTQQAFYSLVSFYCNNTGSETMTELQVDVINDLTRNQFLIKNITVELAQCSDATFSFKTNKNYEILTESLRIVKEIGMPKCEELQQYFTDPEIPASWTSYIQTTGTFTAVQTIVLHAMAVVKNTTNVTEMMLDTPDISHLYNVDYSPVLQGVSLPQAVTEHLLYTNFTQSLYFYKDLQTPTRGEMLALHNGYFFGGSREDNRYLNKEFRAEDCSSAVAKWVNSQVPFSTTHMKNAFYNSCNDDQYCREVSKVLQSLGEDLNQVEPGDIYVFKKGAHTGIVSSLLNESCFKSLSFARDIPHIDGLSEGLECLTTKNYLFFSPVCESDSEL